jgi:hypothetical protein
MRTMLAAQLTMRNMPLLFATPLMYICISIVSFSPWPYIVSGQEWNHDNPVQRFRTTGEVVHSRFGVHWKARAKLELCITYAQISIAAMTNNLQ